MSSPTSTTSNSLTSSPSSRASSISTSQTVFSSSVSFSPNTDYVVVPVEHSRLVGLLKAERGWRLKFRSAFQRDVMKSQKKFEVLQKRFDATENGPKHDAQSLVAQLGRCVEYQCAVCEKMRENRASLQRIDAMLRALAHSAKNDHGAESADANPTYYGVHVPCDEGTVRLLNEVHIDPRTIRFTAESNLKQPQMRK